MKPWESKETIKILRRLKGTERIKLGIELTESAIHILADGIRNSSPRITSANLKRKVYELIWKVRPWVMGKS